MIVVGVWSFSDSGRAATNTPIALRAAFTRMIANLGDPQPTYAGYVETTREEAQSFAAATPMEDSQPVYLVELRGKFVAHGAHVPPGRPLPVGTVATFTVDVTSGQVLDFGINDLTLDLSRLGTVHDLMDELGT